MPQELSDLQVSLEFLFPGLATLHFNFFAISTQNEMLQKTTELYESDKKELQYEVQPAWIRAFTVNKTCPAEWSNLQMQAVSSAELRVVQSSDIIFLLTLT